MSVEAKIKELLTRANEQKQLTEESAENLNAAGYGDAGSKAASSAKKDTSKAGQAAIAGDTTQPKQGSSEDPSIDKLDDLEPGKTAAAKASKEPNTLNPKGDAKSVKTQAMEDTEQDEEVIAEEEAVDVSAELNSIFGEDLSEEFKAKASSIFEAAVIARVNSEMDKVVAKLEEQAAAELLTFKETIVEKVDGYLNYVVEQWMVENQVAIDSGLRTEIAEDFISGLKNLFVEHYIEVPEEKYDVMDELQTVAQELETKLNESIDENIELAKELEELKASKIFEEQAKDLADTEVSKLKKLVEGIDFGSEDLYREKISVIKENYFPKAAKNSPEKMLVEESGSVPAFNGNDPMAKYVQSLSRTIKSR